MIANRSRLTCAAALAAALFFAPVAAHAQAATNHIAAPSLGTSLIVKPGTGALLGFNCTGIAGGAAGFCVAYNSATVPSTGALTGAQVLDFCYFDTTARGCSLSRLPMAASYSTGIVILMTSAITPYTYTTGTDTGAISADFQ
jgi:hypothetical protein